MINRKIFPETAAVFFAAALFLPLSPARGEEQLPISALHQEGGFYDGRLVRVRGEAIGDLMLRGETGWLNIHDGTGAVGVFGPTSLIGRVKLVGRHKITGDLVEVTGFFRNACPDHGGGVHIHALDLVVSVPGFVRDETVSHEKFLLAGGLLLLALLALVFRQHVRRKIPAP